MSRSEVPVTEQSKNESDKSKDTLQAGCGGVAPSSPSDQPRVEPPDDEEWEWGTAETDPFAEHRRDLSTNNVGKPLYELPPEDGRDTWGWDHSPDSLLQVVAYLLHRGAVLPQKTELALRDFANHGLSSMTENERTDLALRIQAIQQDQE